MTVATVQAAPDARKPGRTAYAITGPTAGAVQDAIDTVSRTVDAAFGGRDGMSVFIGPLRSGNQWRALGETVVYQPEQVQA